MHNRLASIVLSLLTLSASLAAQEPGTQEPGTQERATEPHPMRGFERFASSEWRMSLENGSSQFDTWTWGPGRFSVANQTYGFGAEGEPWRVLDVYYWDPGRGQIRLLGLHSNIPALGRGVSEGTLLFEDGAARAHFDLFQPGHGRPARKMELRWSFRGDDEYRETLLESRGGDEFAPLAGWDYFRAETRSTWEAEPSQAAPRPSRRLRALERLLASTTWSGRTELANKETLTMLSTFEWIPYLDVVRARLSARLPASDDPLALETFLYYHPSADAVRCLALANSGVVSTGELTVLDDGTLQIELEGQDGERVQRWTVRLGHDSWTLESEERSLVFEVQAKGC